MKRRAVLLCLLLCVSAWGQKTKPLVGSRIAWGHPVARGLIACFLMNETTGTICNDLGQNGQAATLQSTATWGTGGVLCDAANESILTGTQLPTVGSCFLRFKSTVGPVTYARFFQANITFRRQNASSIGLGSGTGDVLWTTPTPWDGVLHSFVVTWDDPSNIRQLWQDGIFYGADATAWANGSGISTQMGGDGSAKPVGGIVYCIYFWNRVLTAADVAMLAQDPFCFIQNPDQQLLTMYQTPAAGGASQVIIISEASMQTAFWVIAGIVGIGLVRQWRQPSR
jgi:hypothetical protein